MNKVFNLFISLCLVFAVFTPAWAAEANTQNIISNEKILVSQGETVRNILLVGNDGIIAGQVQDEVIVLNGNLTLKNTAKIADRVIVIGGGIKQEPGASVGKGVFNFNTANTSFNSMLIGALTFIGLELAKLLLSLGIILVVLFISLISPKIVKNGAVKLKGNIFKTIIGGLLSTLAFSLLTLALIASVWGIPLALIIIIAVAFLAILGLTSMCNVFGEIFKGLNPFKDSTIAVTGLGSLLFIALLNLPIIGFIWGFVALILSLGALIQLLFKRE